MELNVNYYWLLESVLTLKNAAYQHLYSSPGCRKRANKEAKLGRTT